MLTLGGVAYESRGAGWVYLSGGVKSIGRANAGLAVVVFTTGDAYEHDAAGWHPLTSSVVVGA